MILREQRVGRSADEHYRKQNASELLSSESGLHMDKFGQHRQENYGSNIVTKKIPFFFSLLNPTNIYLIKELNRIEHEIIEHYKEFFQIHKTNVYSLRNQLKSGNIKVVHKIPYLYSDCEDISHISVDIGPGVGVNNISITNVVNDRKSSEKVGKGIRGTLATELQTSEGALHPSKFGHDTTDYIRPIVVKISGIWETDMNIGITFKFQI
jgi:hypothetical protein